MNKATYILISMLGVATSVNAQTWTATDINGTQHSVQDDLNQGKTVLVCFITHFGGDGWNWHRSEVMQQIYYEFGPSGTNDVTMYLVDANPTSTLGELQGQGSTQGDWTEDTPYPIIGPNGEGAAVASNYTFTPIPTLFVHCPDSAEAMEIPTADLWTFVNLWRATCPNGWVNGANDATVIRNPSVIELCPDDSPTALIYNQGDAPLTSATVELKQGGTVLETVNWTGNLPPAVYSEVVFPNTTISTSEIFDVEVSMPNGAVDDNPAGALDSVEFDVSAQMSFWVEVEIQTDNYGDETYWRILDPSGGITAEGGNITMGAAGGQGPNPPNDGNSYSDNEHDTTAVFFTETGCHKFEIYDYVGDGMCCSFGIGYFKVRDMNSGALIIDGDAFGAESKHQLFSNAVGVNELALQLDNVNMFPNPTAGKLTIQTTLDRGDVLLVEVMDMLGSMISSYSFHTASGLQSNELDLGELVNGIYFVKVTTGQRGTVRKVTLNK